METTLKIDVPLLSQSIAEAGAEAKAFEDMGIDGVFGLEGPHDPFVPLIVAGAQTKKIELLTAIAVAFARNPMSCAYLANDVQLASEGRFILGLGTQVKAHIERRFGQAWSKPNARIREFVLAMRAIFKCWETAEPLDFKGEFYSHTLMPPLFNPGPNPFGSPPIYLAGFGPNMIRSAGEVADGWMVHPLHTTSYLRDCAFPALEEGLSRAGRGKADCKVSLQLIVMIGGDDAQVAKAQDSGRAQIAFYCSTKAYRPVLEHHGWEALQPELNAMTREGKWLEMIGKVPDEVVDAVGVSGTPAEAGALIRERCAGIADRISLTIYNETGDPEAVRDLADAVRG